MYSQIAQQNIITYIYECIGGERKRDRDRGREGRGEREIWTIAANMVKKSMGIIILLHLFCKLEIISK